LALLGPETAHSPNADDMTTLYWVMLVLAVILVVAINGALVALAVRYRGGRGRTPRRLRSRGRAQLTVAGAFGLLAAAVFVAGVVYTSRASDVEASGPDGLQSAAVTTAQRDLSLPVAGGNATEPLRITASGQQWIWRYQYPDGTFSYYELVVPVDTAVLVHVISTDVVHRWWVQGLSAKSDAVPGESNWTWFKADQTGVYDGASYAFSGASYATMRTRVRVVTVPEYQAWLEQQSNDISAAQSFVQEKLASGGPLAKLSRGEEP
jgi:heme/copper-type cytochrome/quinol oxidase subunit 2